jgi:hypothetical protein
MSTALSRLQKAIYSRLSSDGVLMGMISDIHDNVPETATYPLLVIGDGEQKAIAADAALGDACQIRIHSYSQKAGRKETLTILDRVYGLLHYDSLTLTGGEVLHLRIAQAETEYDIDSNLIHGELRVQALVSAG